MAAIHEDDTQWFTRICQQLDDQSVCLQVLILSCNSRLPLHLLMPKVATCNTISLRLSRQGSAVPLITDNLDRLQQLSNCLCSPQLTYVDVTCEDYLPARWEQLQVLLQHASKLVYQMYATLACILTALLGRCWLPPSFVACGSSSRVLRTRWLYKTYSR